MNFGKSGRLRIQNTMVREALAEFLGTCVLMLVGTGAAAQLTLSRGKLGSVDGAHWAAGIGVAMAIYVAGGVSGGHVNPCLSLALACVGKLEWKKVPVYMAAQYLGSFTASVLVYIIYKDALTFFDGGSRQFDGENGTAGIWATYPQPFVSLTTAFADEVLTSAILLMMIVALVDNRNMQVPRSLFPITVGLCVVGLGMAFHTNCGYALNPARDLSPRIFTAITGWGSKPFSFRDYNWFWIPVIGPYIGGVFGAFVYQLCVGFHWPVEEHDLKECQKVKESYVNTEYEISVDTKVGAHDNAGFDLKETNTQI